MLPIAIGMVLASKLAIGLTRRLGTKFSVTLGLATVAGALAMIATFDTDTTGLQIALALGALGLGMGFAMSPATEAIMGALPRAKAGIGSAMNDVVREVGGMLGIAVLGSILSSGYGSGMDDATAGLPHAATEAASDSVGAAHEIGAQHRRRSRRQADRHRQQRVRRRPDHDRHPRGRGRRDRRAHRPRIPALARPRRASGAARHRAARAGPGLIPPHPRPPRPD